MVQSGGNRRRRDASRGVSGRRSAGRIPEAIRTNPPGRRVGRRVTAARVVERSGGPMGDELLRARPLRSDPDPPKEASCCRPSRPRASSRTSSTPPTGCARPWRASSPVGPSSSGSPSPSCSPRGTCSSRTCPGSARRRSPRRWPRPSTARSAGSSSPRTCCRRDLTGVNIFRSQTHEFEFRPGPVFAHVVIGDEINRASPKTQSALLECMQEAQATVDGRTYPLPRPFLVVATQNPVEMEGTYPLPEAQRDRFMARLTVGYPSIESELRHARPAGDVRPARHPAARDRRRAGARPSSRPRAGCTRRRASSGTSSTS